MIAAACARRAPAPPTPEELSQFSRFSRQLTQALERGDDAEVRRALAAWRADMPPLALEGDFYAATLTGAPVAAPAVRWVMLAQAFAKRFPEHAARWQGVRVLMADALENGRFREAAQWWGDLHAAPDAVQARYARWLSELLWRDGQQAASLQWLQRGIPPRQETGAFWSLAFTRAWQCCQVSDVDGGVLAELLMLKAAIAAGDQDRIRSQAKTLRRLADRRGMDDRWRQWLVWLASAEQRGQSRTVAAALPLNGRQERLGTRVMATAAACLPEGASIALRDTRGNPAVAASLIAEDSQTAAYLGPLRGVELATAGPLAFHRGQRLVTVNPNPFQRRDHYPAIWWSGVSPEQQARAIARLLAEERWRGVATLAPDNRYGDRFLNVFWNAVTRTGGWFTGVGRYPPDETDFGPVIRRLVGLERYLPEELEEMEEEGQEPQPILDFDALVVAGSPSVLGLLTPQLAYYDIAHVRVIGDANWMQADVSELVPSVRNYVLFASPVPPASGTRMPAQAEPFWSCVTAVDARPGSLALSVFDAHRLATAASTQARKTDGAGGRIEINAEREIQRPYFIWRWQGTTPVPWDGVDPLERNASVTEPTAQPVDPSLR